MKRTRTRPEAGEVFASEPAFDCTRWRGPCDALAHERSPVEPLAGGSKPGPDLARPRSEGCFGANAVGWLPLGTRGPERRWFTPGSPCTPSSLNG
jgi:hypothetical protein